MSIATADTQRGRPKDEAKRQAILDAARALFLAQPYDRVSVDAIAAAAGVSKVTVYSHFEGGKEALFVAAISQGCSALFTQAFIAIETGDDLEQALAQLGADFVSMISSDEVGALHQVMLAEGARHPELPAQFYRSVVQRSTLELAAHLAREASRGVIACDAPEQAAEQFLAMVQGQIVYRVELGLGPTPPEEVAAYTRACAALFMRALRP